jgi:DNA-binding beta-propeller fold protein YncE
MKALAHPPTGIAVDRRGNIYIVDVVSNAVFKITRNGRVQVLAGEVEAGYSDGIKGRARFNHPHGLTRDARGNLYVGDYDNNRVRKIAPDGRVTTLAGSGEMGFAGGRGTSAKLERPAALAADAQGNIYVAHDRNGIISKISPRGEVSMVALIERVSSTSLDPRGIAVDPQGNIYLASGHRILKITPDGQQMRLAGSAERGFADGRGSQARFNMPWGIAVDNSGNVYVADLLNNRIRKVTPDGMVTTLPGIFDGPCGVTVDHAGNVYVLDRWERPCGPLKIRAHKIRPNGSLVTLIRCSP